ncbi:MAG: hypothetical protein AAGJ87_09400 [Pseudomonadota bacterium]
MKAGPAIGLMLTAALSACADLSDPTEQAPVDPEAGLYAIDLSARGFLQETEAEREAEICLREADRTGFAHALMEKMFKLHYSCSAEAGERVGNAVSGEVKCLADPKLARGMNRFVYAGAVGEDSVALEAQIKFDATLKNDALTKQERLQMKLAMKALEQMRMVVNATRTGDC